MEIDEKTCLAKWRHVSMGYIQGEARNLGAAECFYYWPISIPS
jgi:hypothetical protein